MSTIMLYRHPGKYELHGDKFDYIIVDSEKTDEYLSKGWYLTTVEALTGKHRHEEPPPPEPKPKHSGPRRNFADLTPEERMEIGTADKGIHPLAAEYNISSYSVTRCRRELVEGKNNKRGVRRRRS